jgi:hypothetical protein
MNALVVVSMRFSKADPVAEQEEEEKEENIL